LKKHKPNNETNPDKKNNILPKQSADTHQTTPTNKKGATQQTPTNHKNNRRLSNTLLSSQESHTHQQPTQPCQPPGQPNQPYPPPPDRSNRPSDNSATPTPGATTAHPEASEGMECRLGQEPDPKALHPRCPGGPPNITGGAGTESSRFRPRGRWRDLCEPVPRGACSSGRATTYELVRRHLERTTRGERAAGPAPRTAADHVPSEPVHLHRGQQPATSRASRWAEPAGSGRRSVEPAGGPAPVLRPTIRRTSASSASSAGSRSHVDR
jgi:hypothetical protein